MGPSGIFISRRRGFTALCPHFANDIFIIPPKWKWRNCVKRENASFLENSESTVVSGVFFSTWFTTRNVAQRVIKRMLKNVQYHRERFFILLCPDAPMYTLLLHACTTCVYRRSRRDYRRNSIANYDRFSLAQSNFASGERIAMICAE